MAVPTEDHAEGRVPPEAVIDDLLADSRRELILRILRQRGEPMVIDDLARAVCAAEADPGDAAVEGEKRMAVRSDIFERHLPKLTAIEAVRYDSMVGTAEYLGAGDLCERLER
jgi:hypothetical protein